MKISKVFAAILLCLLVIAATSAYLAGRSRDAQEAAAIAAEALANPEKLAEIAQAGGRVVARRHTDTARAVSLTQMLAEMCAAQAHRERLEQSLEKRTALVRGAYGMISSELLDPQLEAHRVFFEKMCLRQQ